MNAVVMLFINDLDEKFLDMLIVVAPIWTNRIIEEIENKVNFPTHESNGTKIDLNEGTNNNNGDKSNISRMTQEPPSNESDDDFDPRKV